MKYFWKPGVLLLCALSGAVAVSGCSRNVAAVPDVAVASPTAQAVESAATADAASKPAASTKQIQWQPSLDSALALAKKTQKPVMIDFYATWCPPCKLLDQEIYPAADVVREAENFISVKIDVDKEPALQGKYQAFGLPTIVFLDASGNEIHRQLGIDDGQVGSFVKTMRTARALIAPTAA